MTMRPPGASCCSNSSGNRNAAYMRRAQDLFLENLKRYLAGEPLLNVVTRDKGY